MQFISVCGKDFESGRRKLKLVRHNRQPNMTSTPPRTRSHTPSPSPRPASRVSTPQPRFPRSRTVSQATLTALPPRLHVTAATSTAISSPTSSVLNADMSEGIILRDADEEDPDVAESEEQVEGVFAESTEDGEERKKVLREHLRRSLSRKDTSTPLNTNWHFLIPTMSLNRVLSPTGTTGSIGA